MTDKLIETDGQILLWIQDNLRNSITDPIVSFITHLGDYGAVMIAAVLILTAIPKTRRLGLLCLTSLVACLLINNVIIKHAVARTRPYEVVDGLRTIVGKQHDTSFPSGHASGSFVMAAVIINETRKRIWIPVLIFAVLIALSRLYVGVHYPTDVLVGIISGTLTGIITCLIYHNVIAKNKQRLHR